LTSWSPRQQGAQALRRPGEPREPTRAAGSFSDSREATDCLRGPESSDEERKGVVDVESECGWSGGGGAASVHGWGLHGADRDPGPAADAGGVPRRGSPEGARVAVLIASRNGEATIGETIRSIGAQADAVFVVSDASTDGTVEVARAAGASVLALDTNVGKPAALYALIAAERIVENFDFVTILDDDTVIAGDFVDKCLASFRPDVAIVTGRTESRRAKGRARLNPLLASRAFAYWRYQVTLRRGQSALGVLNCISGSNSMFRASILAEVIVPETPYIVDDTFWTMEVQRRKLGRIVYAPGAIAAVCDPTSFRDWYKQNLRWLWGTCQGIIGHRVGLRPTLFDFASVLLVLDWILYVFGPPTVLVLFFLNHPFTSFQHYLLFYVAGFAAWLTIASLATRRPEIVLMAPAIAVLDFVYRVIFVHAAIKAIRQPRVASCTWASPKRYA
jgi:cellulose synthase/poly-beta-1,6-N-acetylglucosamine synthase-like glycosyltransferase